jgi:hypothetical protein
MKYKIIRRLLTAIVLLIWLTPSLAVAETVGQHAPDNHFGNLSHDLMPIRKMHVGKRFSIISCIPDFPVKTRTLF